ncbi:MAG TPA: hypothetical protein PK858_05265, partial [Saprospiraceae bacterium]|nr:hypothetical protein [Saprospiraceae bacterium]
GYLCRINPRTARICAVVGWFFPIQTVPRRPSGLGREVGVHFWQTSGMPKSTYRLPSIGFKRLILFWAALVFFAPLARSVKTALPKTELPRFRPIRKT